MFSFLLISDKAMKTQGIRAGKKSVQLDELHGFFLYFS